MTISNNDLKKYSSLNRKNKRKEHQLFVVEGEKICKELIKNDFEYESIFTTKDLQNEFPLSTCLYYSYYIFLNNMLIFQIHLQNNWLLTESCGNQI